MTQTQAVGLKLGDLCQIITPHKNKKRIQLNRTSWEILPEGDVASGDCPAITVPGARPRSFRWKLELREFSGSQRFILRSVDDSFFKLNGQFSREALVESFDVLSQDGFSGRLEFHTNFSLKKMTHNHWPQELENEALIQSRLPVLIQGETGSGKSHLAREIHQRSKRSGEFVGLNLSAMNEALIESELFGHMKGAFTGAVQNHQGAFAQARAGTIFLDEIDSLSHSLQLKLLLFLDSGRFRPVGARGDEVTDARVIFASGQKLEVLVKNEKIRRDFYFRLSQGITCQLKSLRDDPSSILRHCQIYGIEHQLSFSKRLTDFYQTLPWPGNLRQLRGHLDNKRIRSKTHKLDFDEMDDRLMVMSSDLLGLDFERTVRPLEEMKREYIKHALDLFHGRQDLAAKELQINVKTLKAWVSNEPRCG